jgi:hypothetical protein
MILIIPPKPGMKGMHMQKTITIEDNVNDEVSIQVTAYPSGKYFVTIVCDGACSFPVENLDAFDKMKQMAFNLIHEFEKENA